MDINEARDECRHYAKHYKHQASVIKRGNPVFISLLTQLKCHGLSFSLTAANNPHLPALTFSSHLAGRALIQDESNICLCLVST